jgi:hypothetical protein
VYLDLDPARFPTPGGRDVELSALLGRAGARGADAKCVREALNVDPELARGAHSIAIFSCAAAGILEVVALPEPVEPLAVVDSAPWLEPLAAMVTTEAWGVAVVSRRAARLFRGGPQGLVEFAVVRDDLHRRHAQGGWSRRASSAESRGRSPCTYAMSPNGCCERTSAARSNSSSSSLPVSSGRSSRPAYIAICAIESPE